jgi:hypothetical protein
LIDDELVNKLSEISCSDVHFTRYNKLLSSDISNNYDYYELHHYLPRSLFPEYSNCQNNIIRVPGKLHYILHLLLVKITKTPQMIMAFNNMSRIKSTKKSTSKLYAISRNEFVKVQRNRRHYYNKITGDRIFSLESQNEDWQKGMSPECNNGKHSSWNWIHDPLTRIQKRISKDVDIPNGFIKGRINGTEIGLSYMNDRKRYYSLIQKKIVFSEIKNDDYCNDHGGTISEVYKFKDKATISKKYIIDFLFGVSNDALARKDPHKFIIPAPHFNMNKDWNNFCEKNRGKTLIEIGMKIIPISEFIYANEVSI